MFSTRELFFSFSPRRLEKIYHSSANVFSTDIKHVFCSRIFLFRFFTVFFFSSVLCKSSVTFSVVPHVFGVAAFWTSTAKTKQGRLVYSETSLIFSASCLF